MKTIAPLPLSSELPSTRIESILNRPRFVCDAISVIVIRDSGSKLVMVIVSLLSQLSPKFSTCPGLSTNGSFFVPLPLTKLGLAVVCSGSGPFFIPTSTIRDSPFSLDQYISGIRSSSSSNGKQTQIHHIVEELLSSSSSLDSVLTVTQVVSSSMFSGILSESRLSEPHLSSSASDHVSPSSSSSALSPTPSPSVSSHSLLSIGNASSASETPSPSVSSSSASQVPSSSESTGKSESSSGSVPHSDSL